MKARLPAIAVPGAVLALLAAALPVGAQTDVLLHTFGQGGFAKPGLVWTNGDGANPCGGLALSGGTMYGAAKNGGTNGTGTLFAVDTNGTFNRLYTFPADLNGAGNGFGANPNGGLILLNGRLYGTTYNGGSADNGLVFSIVTNGTGILNLHTFLGGNSDGVNPSAGLVSSGVWLYGTTSFGGSGANGMVFSVKTNGTSFTPLHIFSADLHTNSLGAYTNADGANPAANLILSGITLYGTTSAGGTNGYGTVFAINTIGTGFTVLHHFDTDGANPTAGLLLTGGTLLGLGGSAAFALNTNGSGFVVLQQFDASVDAAPNATPGLTAAGPTILGALPSGGASGSGETFLMNSNGANFASLYDFTPTVPFSFPKTNSDGAFPNGGLLLLNGMICGTAGEGGVWGNGVIFEAPPPIQILPPQLSSGNLLFGFQTLTGLGYTVQQNTNLAGTNWVAFTNIIGDGTVRQFTAQTTNAPQLFFRVRQP